MELMNGQPLPRIGQGTWYMGESSGAAREETAALRTAVDSGLTLIDTAEMYGEGASERLIGRAMEGVARDSYFLCSKVYPHNAGGSRLRRSCEQSLRRLNTDVIDLYMLHWMGAVPLDETIEGMRALQQAGMIRYWGVSNLDRRDMEELLEDGGADCQVDQVLYHLGSRGTEYDLMPFLKEQGILMVGYCPLAQAGRLRRGMLENPAVQQIAHQHGWTPAQVLLAFACQDNLLPIPKAATPAHVRENAAMLTQSLTAQERSALDAAFPAPRRATPLDIV